VAALLESVQLPPAYARRLPRELSGGERQRVGIARALAVEPQALICDEPIASLDVSVGAQILQLLRELSRQRGMALLFISHDLRAVAWLCERIAVMRQGRLVETGPTETLLTKPVQPYTSLLIRSANLDLDAPVL
jgi:ABC-type oligopeptide transport system ATPase subunit